MADASFRQKGEPTVTLTMISLPTWDWLIEIKCLYDSDMKLKGLWHNYWVGTQPPHYSVKNKTVL